MTERVSVSSTGAELNGWSNGGAVNSDGRFVVYRSYATNFVANDTNGVINIFLRDRGPQIVNTFIGFNSPVDNLLISNSAKAGSTIPVKWQLTDSGGGYVSDLSVVEALQYAPVACDSQDIEFENPIDALASGGAGLHYDTASNQFIFNWKTLKSQKNTCAVFALTLTDGQQQFARFWLK